jgi:hypothetical protein
VLLHLHRGIEAVLEDTSAGAQFDSKSYEAAVEMGRKIDQLLAKGMSWPNVAKRFDVSVETARKRRSWANEEDGRQKDTA